MSDLPQTRRSLLLELGKRNDLAWTEFLKVYEQAIVRYCRSRGLQEADALDAAQEVYAAIHAKMENWDHDSNRGKFRAWLFRVARNITVDLIDSRAKRESATGGSQVVRLLAETPSGNDLGGEQASAQNPQSDSFQREWQQAVFEWAAAQVRREVRDVTWQAFCKTALEGRKAEIVATELEVPVGSVYTSKCRVMARIRNKIATMDSEAVLNEESEGPTKDR